MELFKQNTTIDFMGARRWTAFLSIMLFVLAMISIGYKGINWGLDFTGGTQIELTFPELPDLDFIRTTLEEAGFSQTVVQNYGTSKDVLISLNSNKAPQEVVDTMLRVLPQAEKKRVEYVGPQVGQELMTKGILAILIAMLGTMVYIALRFEYRFAVSAVLALVHDPLLILGVFSFYQLPFDLKTLAALLAVIGYSLNDTIVVFDRVRENFRKMRKATTLEILNCSINQTLSRTIMTSVSTLLVVVALFLYGGEVIHGFSLALILGIGVGTYSSIYVAGSLALALGLSKQDFVKRNTEVIDNRP